MKGGRSDEKRNRILSKWEQDSNPLPSIAQNSDALPDVPCGQLKILFNISLCINKKCLGGVKCV